MTTPRPAVPVRRTSSPPPPSDVSSTKRIEIKPREVVHRAPIVALNAVEGFGKTTIGAHAPKPLIAMSDNERGYDTLLAHGLVPQVPAVVMDSFTDTLALVRQLTDDPEGIETLVMDATGGFEYLCRKHVCERDFAGDWGESGFASYGKGTAATAREWRLLTAALEQLRDKRNVGVLLLGHVKIESFKNPTGTDYNRYASDLDKSIYGITAKFCDAVLFGTFYQAVDATRAEAKKNVAERRGKVVGEAQRVIVTEKRDGFDAKNRYGLPSEIWLDCDAAGMYDAIFSHITKE